MPVVLSGNRWGHDASARRVDRDECSRPPRKRWQHAGKATQEHASEARREVNDADIPADNALVEKGESSARQHDQSPRDAVSEQDRGHQSCRYRKVIHDKMSAKAESI